MGTFWAPNLSRRSGARYRAIADCLSDDIADGRLPAGTRLPTHRALAERLGVTVGTVTRAYAEAERRGLVEATVGRGTFVTGQAATEATWDSVSPAVPASGDWLGADARRLAFEAVNREMSPARDRMVDLSANYPVGTDLGRLLASAASQMQDPARLHEIAGYQSVMGRREHRAAGVRWLTGLGLDCGEEEILMAPATQGGLMVVLNALTRPGDTILCEALTWPGIKTLARGQHLDLAPVAMDEEGLRPDALAEACRKTQARLLYTMPSVHNPTTITMPEARRREILAVARKHDLIVVEDDVYGFLADNPPPPLAALDPARAIYVTSLSKAVAPGLRLGFLKAPEDLMARLGAAVRSNLLMISTVVAEMGRVLIESGAAAEAAAQQRAQALARQRMLHKRLGQAQLSTMRQSFHAWLTLPERWRTNAFVARALSRGVVVSPGEAFALEGDPRAVRLCLCAPEQTEDLDRGLTALADILAREPEAGLPMV